jgi:hypothetical protein
LFTTFIRSVQRPEVVVRYLAGTHTYNLSVRVLVSCEVR